MIRLYENGIAALVIYLRGYPVPIKYGTVRGNGNDHR
jgi:hypothetical protein